METVGSGTVRRPASSLAVSRVPSFYVRISLLILALIAYGFSRTINDKLIHPSIERPLILYIHAATAFGWLASFTAQAVLVQSRRLRLHRRLGWAVVVNGALLPAVGIPMAIAMARFNILHGLNSPEFAAAFLIVSFNDLVAFSGCLILAILWRRIPEYHRRLMFMATCCLTGAAFGRFPFNTMEGYAGIDALLLLGVGHDLLVSRKVHPVYVYGLPVLILGQLVTLTVFFERIPMWMAVAHRLID